MLEQLRSLNHQSYGPFTLYRHIGETLEIIAQEQPADPLGALEDVSILLWKERHIHLDPQLPPVPEEELDGTFFGGSKTGRYVF
jgi:hypothetical protein